MPCWNGLSEEQQATLIEVGTLEIGYQPQGWCKSGAAVQVETMFDHAPGPRFYCRPCAAQFLGDKGQDQTLHLRMQVAGLQEEIMHLKETIRFLSPRSG